MTLIEEYLWWNKGIRADELSREDIFNLLPEEWAPVLSTNDLVEAYRQCPVAEEDSRASIIAIWVEDQHQWMFCEMYGLAFGFSASVLAFNRGPTLTVAATRRVTGTLVAAYFDDLPALDTIQASPSAHTTLQAVLNLLGTSNLPPKHSLRPHIGYFLVLVFHWPK